MRRGRQGAAPRDRAGRRAPPPRSPCRRDRRSRPFPRRPESPCRGRATPPAPGVRVRGGGAPRASSAETSHAPATARRRGRAGGRERSARGGPCRGALRAARRPEDRRPGAFRRLVHRREAPGVAAARSRSFSAPLPARRRSRDPAAASDTVPARPNWPGTDPGLCRPAQPPPRGDPVGPTRTAQRRAARGVPGCVEGVPSTFTASGSAPGSITRIRRVRRNLTRPPWAPCAPPIRTARGASSSTRLARALPLRSRLRRSPRRPVDERLDRSGPGPSGRGARPSAAEPSGPWQPAQRCRSAGASSPPRRSFTRGQRSRRSDAQSAPAPRSRTEPTSRRPHAAWCPRGGAPVSSLHARPPRQRPARAPTPGRRAPPFVGSCPCEARPEPPPGPSRASSPVRSPRRLTATTGPPSRRAQSRRPRRSGSRHDLPRPIPEVPRGIPPARRRGRRSPSTPTATPAPRAPGPGS